MLTGIHHIAYVVEDMDASLSTFETLFDEEPVHRMRRDDEFVLETALYHVDGQYIEFISPISERGWAYEYLSEHGEGFFHVGYEVDDLDASIESLREQGVGLVTEEPQSGVGGAWRLITIEEGETVVPTQLVQDDRDDRSVF
ncbi:MAG: VOC family protein [Halobacteriota archaeon]